MAKEGNFVLVRLPSNEVRKFHKICRACIGQVAKYVENLKVKN